MQRREFILQARLDTAELDRWVAAGWLVPRRMGAKRAYSHVDLARAHLIRDLQHLGVNDESVPIVLDLVDQLHGLRRMVRTLLASITTQQQRRREPSLSRRQVKPRKS
jgi:chaperone modulatory protein CbpM